MLASMAAYVQLLVHLVWATEDRTPWIVPTVEQALYAAIAAKCRELRCPPVAVGGVADHVHLLVSLAPTVSVATLVQKIKGSTSHLMTHELAPDAPFCWQVGYGAFSLRREDARVVRSYIQNQKEHHARGTSDPTWEQMTA